MSEIELPEFDLSGSNLDFTSDEEFNEQLEKESKGGPRFQPGINTATIVSPMYHVKDGSIKNQNDPTWITVKIPLVGDGGEQKDQYLLVPTQKLGFTARSGKETLLLYTKFVEFMAAIGVKVERSNAIKVAHAYFSDSSFKKLEGKTLKFEFGFNQKYRLDYQDGVYTCVDKEGTPVTDSEGNVVSNPDRTELEKALAEVGVKSFQSFPEILSFVSAEPKKSEKKKESEKEESNDWGF